MGLGNLFGSFGTIPDILMGKKPLDALTDNFKTAAMLGVGMMAPGLLGAAAPAAAGTAGATAAGSAASAAGTAAAAAPAAEAMTFTKGLDMAAKAAPIAQMGMGLLDQPQAPMQPGQVGRPGADFSGLLAQSPQTDEALRLQKRQMMIQGLLGGRYESA